jgi:hypothetical protein
MFLDLAKRLFEIDIPKENMAKFLVVKYAKKIAPGLTTAEILQIIYNYTGLYSFENTFTAAAKGKIKQKKTAINGSPFFSN